VQEANVNNQSSVSKTAHATARDLQRRKEQVLRARPSVLGRFRRGAEENGMEGLASMQRPGVLGEGIGKETRVSLTLGWPCFALATQQRQCRLGEAGLVCDIDGVEVVELQACRRVEKLDSTRCSRDAPAQQARDDKKGENNLVKKPDVPG